MEANKAVIKEKIVAVLQELPAEKMIEVLDSEVIDRNHRLGRRCCYRL